MLSPHIGGERYAFDIDFFGLRYRGPLGSLIDRQVHFFGAYERDELDFVRAWWGGRPGKTVLDVGANVGHHTLLLSQIFCNRARSARRAHRFREHRCAGRREKGPQWAEENVGALASSGMDRNLGDDTTGFLHSRVRD
jgi:hypothetical protein